MFEQYKSKNILDRIRKNADKDIDKREGSIFFDAVMPFCKELSKNYLLLDKVRLESFASTSSGTLLDRKLEESWVFRQRATKAKFILEVNVNIEIGEIFYSEEFFYKVIEKVDDLKYIIECELKGSIGNTYIGKLTPVNKISGLTFAVMTQIYEEGVDDEKDEELRQRFFELVKGQFFTGKVSDYKEILLKNEKIKRLKSSYNKDENVLTLVLIPNENVDISDEFLKELNESIVKPIDQDVLLKAINEEKIYISLILVYESGYSSKEIYDDILDKINLYFTQLSENVNDNEFIKIRLSQIEILILNIKGVKDVLSLTLNGQKSNITLDISSIPVIGGILFE